MLLIKNGRVIDPVTQIDEKLDVLIDGNTIIKVEKNIKGEYPVIDAS